MLQAVSLRCSRGERRLFTDLNVKVERGSLLAVVGENGSGKTSLLLSSPVCCPLNKVRFCGRDKILRLKELYAGQLTYIGHLNGIKEDLTPLENLMSVMSLAGESCSNTRKRGVGGDWVEAAHSSTAVQSALTGTEASCGVGKVVAFHSSLMAPR